MARWCAVTSRPSGSSRSWARTAGKDELNHRLPPRLRVLSRGAIRMAEQNIDDTKAPTAPRGARPFAGPAAPSAARPFLRPAAPAVRPSGAPFAPPSGTRPVVGRPSLGVVASASRPAPTPIPMQAVGRPVVPASIAPAEYESVTELVAAMPTEVVPRIEETTAEVENEE